MSKVMPGRFAAQMEGDYVVFLIGARINNYLAVQKWLPVSRAMPRMLKELFAQPELGMLHAYPALVPFRTLMVVQYWRSFEQLHAYAHARDKAHLPAWGAFNRAARGNTAVGVFHETYQVREGQYESVYVDMPPFGLGCADTLQEATGRMQGARGRMGMPDEPPPQF